MDFEVTYKACLRIAELLESEQKNKIALRISVDGGGCSGFMYNYTFIDKIDEGDYILEKHGVRIVIDQLSKTFLTKCKLDFIEELGSSYFQIFNPSATAKCGCGNSFNV